MAENSDNTLLRAVSKLSGIGPYGLARTLRSIAKSLGAISLAYNLRTLESGAERPSSFNFYASRRSIARYSHRSEFAGEDDQWLSQILLGGFPVSLFSIVTGKSAKDTNGMAKFLTMVQDTGYKDAYCIPVYGPHRIDAVISFGFDTLLTDKESVKCEGASAIAAMIHTEFIKLYYTPPASRLKLSVRELEVLTWISRGKSAADVSRILQLSPASIDTYTRRLYKKLGVNDRVSAAMTGVKNGLVA